MWSDKPLRHGWRVVLIGFAAAVCAGCAGGDTAVTEDDVKDARAAVAAYKKELQSALREGLRDGPENAIEVCRVKAPRIGADIEREGIVIGRTSHRLRNPKNAPQPWMEPLLAGYAEDGDMSPWRAVRLDSGSIGYVEPIFVQPLCLQCHGSDIAEPVAERIRALYPEDSATGFAAGDFRGLFWVTLAPGSSDG